MRKEENLRVAAPLVPPVTEIHHPDTYWVKNKCPDKTETSGRKREKEENRRETKRARLMQSMAKSKRCI